MTLVPDVVGVTLPGAPTEGDPRGVRDYSTRRALNLTEVVGIRITARRVAGTLMVRVRVLTEHGDFYANLPEDQLKQTPNSWFTRPALDIP